MKISAIICEFNPFHNGHKYLIDSARKSGADIVVCIMSGNFTQRGDVAVVSKYIRTQQALRNGADIVIELPTVYACSSASVFAKNGVELAKSLGCVDTLTFGCECGSADMILKAAEASENELVAEKTEMLLRSGEYYPKALQSSVKEIYGDEISDIFSNPNNILAVEYCKALKDSGILPNAIARINVEHDSHIANGNFASASHIRNMLLQTEEKADKYLPNYEKSDFENLHSIKNLENVIMYRLRTMSADDFKNLPEVMQGLENRIFECARNYNSVSEIIDAIKTKRYTHSRIRRIMIYALLNITKEMQNTPVPYIRVLGFNKNGAYVLSEAKEYGRLPIITKVSKECELSEKGRKILETDLRASDIYTLSADKVTACSDDYFKGTIVIK